MARTLRNVPGQRRKRACSVKRRRRDDMYRRRRGRHQRTREQQIAARALSAWRVLPDPDAGIA